MRIQWLHDAALRLGLIGAVVLTLTSCGAVTGSGTPAVGGDLLVLPAVADLFPDVPTQFSITGGKPGYSVFSSNNIVLPLESAVAGTTFFAIPKSVSSDTPVTITVRDADGKTKAATVTIKPAVINNNVIFTIVTPAGSGCGANALCSGGTAQVLVTASLNGTVLINRPISFAVFQGDFLFVTPGTGTLVNAITVNTDERGEAVVRLTATVGAPPQVATLTSTDVTSGLVRRFNFNIVPRTLSVLPSGTVTFKGQTGQPAPAGQPANKGSCPIGAIADYYIFGGTPPYTVASPLLDVATVSSIVGGTFRATAGGTCPGTVSFVVTDATMTTVETASFITVQGDDGAVSPAPTPTPVATPPTVNPPDITLNTCNEQQTVLLGGTGPFVSSIPTLGGTAWITVALSPTSATIRRTPGSGAPTANPITVKFSNLSGTDDLTVTLAGSGTGGALGACP